jgi:hypothetical protein
VESVGFRLLLSLPVLSSPARLDAIRAESAALPRSPALVARARLEDPLAEFNALIAATEDGAFRERLRGLKSVVQANIISRNEQRDRAARNLLRFGAILAKRIDDVVRIVAGRRAAAAALRKAVADGDTLAAVERQIQSDEAILLENVSAYRDTIAEMIQDYPSAIVDRQLPVVAEELKARRLAQLVPFAERFRNHILVFERNGGLGEEEILRSFR